MDMRKKAALIVTIMNFVLTLAKFVLYAVTGSLVILAEAWHSFSDIVTSLFVFFAVGKRVKEGKLSGADSSGTDAVDEQVESQPRTSRGKWNLEMKVSLGIGGFLFFVSVMLIRYVLVGEKVIVKNPVMAGLIFIGFAIGSYLISRFEGSVGQRFNSVALISDSKHAKADMIASLLAGFSLILYGLGVNIDRMVAFVISLFIFSFSLEVLVNVFMARIRGDREFLFQIKSYQIVSYLFNPRKFYALLTDLDSRLGFGLMQNVWLRRALRWSLRGVPIIALLVYLSTCLYTVGPRDQTLVLRLGKAVHRTAVGPGLHVKLPWPIDRVQTVDVMSIRSKPIGNVTDSQSAALLWTRAHGTEEAFLTGDNYFMFPYIIVHYRIKDLYAYLYQFDDPLLIVEDVTNQTISQLFAKRTFFDIVTKYRAGLSDDLIELVQSDLDAMQVGIEIVSVHFKDIHPPISIADSFEQVIAALQEKEKMINDAYGYRNKNIPEARGQYTGKVERAHSHVVENVDRAQGDARRFLMQNEVFSSHASVLSKKMHLDTMKKALSNTKKIIYDPGAGHPSIWIGNKGAEVLPWQGGME